MLGKPIMSGEKSRAIVEILMILKREKGNNL